MSLSIYIPILRLCLTRHSIVFVHGLTGNTATTWLHEESGSYWPTALLTQDITDARILAFGYDADVVNFWSPASQNRVGNHAGNMLGGLTRLREKSKSVRFL